MRIHRSSYFAVALAAIAVQANVASAADSPEGSFGSTTEAMSVTETGAVLNASLTTASPIDSVITRSYHFEYGTTSAYGSSTGEVTTSDGANPAMSVSETISGLVANTTYHYKVVVKLVDNYRGSILTMVASGGDKTFTTSGGSTTDLSVGSSEVTAPPSSVSPDSSAPVSTIAMSASGKIKLGSKLLVKVKASSTGSAACKIKVRMTNKKGKFIKNLTQGCGTVTFATDEQSIGVNLNRSNRKAVRSVLKKRGKVKASVTLTDPTRQPSSVTAVISLKL